MGMLVTGGAMLQCSFGAAPGTLTVLPATTVVQSMPYATIMDNAPMVNIAPFGTCMSLANPTVASATAAAMGVLTPMPCIPVTCAPWVVGQPKILVANKPALTMDGKLMCNWGGVIQVIAPGQFKAMG